MSRRHYPAGIREHHIAFTKETWNSQNTTQSIRNNQWLKPPIDDITHAALHDEVPTVPLLDHISAHYVEESFEPIPGNYFRTVDSLLFALESSKHHYHTNKVQRELTSLVMMAVDLQRPFITEGLYRGSPA